MHFKTATNRDREIIKKSNNNKKEKINVFIIYNLCIHLHKIIYLS